MKWTGDGGRTAGRASTFSFASGEAFVCMMTSLMVASMSPRAIMPRISPSCRAIISCCAAATAAFFSAADAALHSATALSIASCIWSSVMVPAGGSPEEAEELSASRSMGPPPPMLSIISRSFSFSSLSCRMILSVGFSCTSTTTLICLARSA